MNEIAAEVGFTAPALYAYFESKEAIFAELFRTLSDELDGAFIAGPAGATFSDQASRMLRHLLEWTDRRRDVFVAFQAMQARGGPGSEIPPHVRASARGARWRGPGQLLERMTRWVTEAARHADDLGGHAPDEAACLLFGITHGFFVRWISTEAEQRLADQTDRILDYFFHGLRGPHGEHS